MKPNSLSERTIFHKFHNFREVTSCCALTLAGSADAQVSQVGSEIPGAVGAAQGWECGFLGIQRRGKRGGEVDVGQVRQGAARVVRGRNQGCSVLLVS